MADNRKIVVAIDADLRPFLRALDAVIEAMEAARDVLECEIASLSVES